MTYLCQLSVVLCQLYVSAVCCSKMCVFFCVQVPPPSQSWQFLGWKPLLQSFWSFSCLKSLFLKVKIFILTLTLEKLFIESVCLLGCGCLLTIACCPLTFVCFLSSVLFNVYCLVFVVCCLLSVHCFLSSVLSIAYCLLSAVYCLLFSAVFWLLSAV